MDEISIYNQQVNRPLRKTAMFFLALLPLLHWYNIGAPVGLGEAIMILITGIAVAMGYFKKNVFPKLFYVLWVYVAFNWYYNNGVHFGLGVLPGGPTFFVFALMSMGGVLLFDLGYLYKYMRLIVIISIPIFLFQFAMLHVFSTHYCFVPNLTGSFTYENLTYAELVGRHYKSMNPCAIFIEKSYMAYYLVCFLCLELFYGKSKDVLFSKLSIVILFTLLILKSGSGLVGMVLPVIIKILIYYWNKKTLRFVMIGLSVLLLIGLVYIYAGTDIGAAMFERQNEITEEGTSGFSRVVLGYSYFEGLSSTQQIFGTSISNLNDLIYLSYADKRFSLNGIQFPLIQLGLVGLLLWIVFYVSTLFRVPIYAKLCILTYFVLSAIEVTYLGPYMTLLTVVPCANYLNQTYSENR